MQELGLWLFIRDKLEKKSPVILMCVADSRGSSPGRRGFKMAVTPSELYGSIGGGIMEWKFVEMSRQRLSSGQTLAEIRKQHHQKSVDENKSGMICSGEQTILLLELNAEHLAEIEKLIDSLQKDKIGLLRLTDIGISFSDDCDAEESFQIAGENRFVYTERTGLQTNLFVIGGGHCSLALCRLMRNLDFRIHLFEERSGINTLVANDSTHRIKIVNDYAELTDLIPAGDHNFVVVMTVGYRTDDIAVRALIHKEFGYFGVLGSKAKMNELFKEWRRGGLPEDKLRKIHAPAGVQINSETPEEIAVSIAAEMIRIRNS